MRFIPACAGNASERHSGLLMEPVHPRVCGERFVGQTSPLSVTRFIPACAGNAWGNMSAANRMSGHPRVCGERRGALSSGSGYYGSSPRVRGTPTNAADTTATGRFIPACAGNASSGSAAINSATVHPRVCGERRGFEDIGASEAGSSPRVRGTLMLAEAPPLAARFIPACAGNARSSKRRPAPIPVHPRVCGERAFD